MVAQTSPWWGDGRRFLGPQGIAGTAGIGSATSWERPRVQDMTFRCRSQGSCVCASVVTQDVLRSAGQTHNLKMSLQHPETTVKSMVLFHAYLDVCNWGKYVDDLRTPGPGAVLEFVSLLPGRTEAKIGNG